MSNFLTSSIGKKIILSLSGLFLIAFLCVHLALNLLLIVDNSGDLFNIGAHFMATNPIIKIVEPILAIGFIIHIIFYPDSSKQKRTSYQVRSSQTIRELYMVIQKHVHLGWFGFDLLTCSPLELLVENQVCRGSSFSRDQRRRYCHGKHLRFGFRTI